MPSSSSGTATIARLRCCTMCTLYIERSAMSWTGQSDASHMVNRPSVQHVTCRRVTGDWPGATHFGPNRTTAIAYPTANSATSSQTSGCGDQAGKRAAAPSVNSGSSAEGVQCREHDRKQDDRGGDPEDEEPAEDRPVRSQVHVPRRDHGELGRGEQ